MTTDLWRHLVTWELRHALRGATFWTMAVTMMLASLLPALAVFNGSQVFGLGEWPAAALPVELVALSLLVSLWTVFAVKRQVAADVSDDWLMALRYRQTVASRHLAGLVIGLLLLGVSVACDLALWWISGAPDDSLPQLLLYQLIKLVSLVQPLAMASVIIAAADFLVAGTAVVLLVLIVVDLAWCAVPICGPAVGATIWLTGEDSGRLGGLLCFLASLGFCLGGVAFGWQKAEDFYAYLKLKVDHRKESMGGVRQAVADAQRTGTRAPRLAASASREFWRKLGVGPLLSFDLARYPWGPRRSSAIQLTWPILAALTALAVAGVYAAAGGEGESWGNYVFFFGWCLAAAFTVTRALVSGAQIVIQEREQGTLGCLLISHLGARRMLAHKLAVVACQAAPLLGLLLLIWRLNPRYGGSPDEPAGLVGFTVVATVAGVVASALASSRLMAILTAVALCVGTYALAVVIAMAGIRLTDATRFGFVADCLEASPSVVPLAIAAGAMVWCAALPLMRRRLLAVAGQA